jgi:aminoglycoside phosphotransferase (APT) family kinase protein
MWASVDALDCRSADRQNGAVIDPVAVLRHLGVGGIGVAQPLTGGTDTLNWRVEAGGEAMVLRVFRPAQGPAADREATAIAAARGVVPVPRIVQRGTWEERPVTLLEWCPGRPLWEVLAQAPVREVEALGIEFGRTQARIHGVDAPAGWATDNWLHWAGETPVVDRLRATTSTMRRRPALLHLDYHPANVLVADGRISGILDWVNALAGDPRADIARTYSILIADPFVRQETWPASAFRHGWRSGYEQEAGRADELAPFVAWAGAVMLRDLAGRLSDDDRRAVDTWSRRWARCSGVSEGAD